MVLHMPDKTQASIRWISGQMRVTYHGLCNHAVLFPRGCEPTLGMIVKLYDILTEKAEWSII